MVEIVDSSNRLMKKRWDVLHNKYGNEYNIYNHDSGWGVPYYNQIYKKIGRFRQKSVLDIFPNEINLYDGSYLDFAKEVANLLKIDRIELHYKE